MYASSLTSLPILILWKLLTLAYIFNCIPFGDWDQSPVSSFSFITLGSKAEMPWPLSFHFRPFTFLSSYLVSLSWHFNIPVLFYWKWQMVQDGFFHSKCPSYQMYNSLQDRIISEHHQSPNNRLYSPLIICQSLTSQMFQGKTVTLPLSYSLPLVPPSVRTLF